MMKYLQPDTREAHAAYLALDMSDATVDGDGLYYRPLVMPTMLCKTIARLIWQASRPESRGIVWC